MKHIKLTITFLIISFSLLSCQRQKEKNHSLSSKENLKFKNLTSENKTGLIMDENEFWKIIEQSIIQSENDYEKQVETLKNILKKLNEKEIEKFQNTFTELMAKSYNWKLWGASYVINGGCSDDCFEYFRGYLIAHGRLRFYQTFENPESCADWIKTESSENWEAIGYSAMDAYREKTGKDMPFTYKTEYILKGEKFNEEKVYEQYPKLSDKF